MSGGVVRLTKAFSVLVLGTLAVVACGGQSLEHGSDGDLGKGGDAGSSGSENGGSSGASGSFSGGSFTGGSPAGGSFTGGTGGVVVTGGVSGTSFGGVAGTGGSSGTAGGGGVCSLPLESGPCDAYVPSFGFSQPDGHCVPFVYGGCQGNDNRFSTLEACEAKCGGSLSQCPPLMPMNPGRCVVEGQTCTYDFGNCLCAVMSSINCVRTDPACVGSFPDGGVSPIVVAAYNSCTCTNGGWECRVVTYGGR